MPFLTIDVGGADLVVEVQRTGSWEKDRSGIDISPAYSGKPLITVTYEERDVWPSYTTGPLTIDQLQALRAAAQFPTPIEVSGDFARTSSSGSAPTITAIVEVGKADHLGVEDGNLYTAPLTITLYD